uniref:Zinc-ribbon domain-containing protein n=1 Tax=Crocodylus porosus TaxID=8502 RepID=A0A7M4EYE6_CROPO
MTRFCPGCGQRLEPAFRFCPGCGEQLPARAQEPPSHGAPAAAAPLGSASAWHSQLTVCRCAPHCQPAVPQP